MREKLRTLVAEMVRGGIPLELARREFERVYLEEVLAAHEGTHSAAARELGKVPSALTYSVRQLEEALDVLLFDRSSRQAQLTAAGTELLTEGRRLLSESWPLDRIASIERGQMVGIGDCP